MRIILVVLGLFCIGNSNAQNMFPNISKKKMNTEVIPKFSDSIPQRNEKTVKEQDVAIYDYLIITKDRDTTYVDTTLTIAKYYKFNSRRTDDFGLLQMANSGQPVNHLIWQNPRATASPILGFKAKSTQFFQPDQNFYYHVPTPLTEMYFKTTFSQGQSSDVLITANLHPRLNYSIGYRGHRSLGHYQHILSGASQLRMSMRYENPSQRYRLRIQIANQKVEQQENGGLTPQSVLDFESEDAEFDERDKLSVKFEDAVNYFTGKRYLIEQDYALWMSNETTPKPKLRLGYRAQTDSQTNTYRQTNATEYYGELLPNLSSINDKVHFSNQRFDIYGILEKSVLGQIEFFGSHFKYSYTLEHLEANPTMDANEYALGGQWSVKLAKFNLRVNLLKSIGAKRIGDQIKVNLITPQWKGIQLNTGLEINSYHPGLVFENYTSAYKAMDWRKDTSLTTRSNFFAKAKLPLVGTLSFRYTNLNNYGYFLQEDPTSLIVSPQQSSDAIKLLTINLKSDYSFGKFALDNQLQYQQVNQEESVLELPEFIARTTLYFQDHWFDKAMFMQMGVSVKYFSKYYANAYNPLLSEFVVQHDKMIGDFPMVDVFFNAKVRQTRLYFRAEHVNSSFTGNTFYSAPDYPYRDFVIRFGLVWNFFK